MGVLGQHHEKKLKKLRKSSWTKSINAKQHTTASKTPYNKEQYVKKTKKKQSKICITIAMSGHCCVGREKWNSFTLRIYVCIRESKNPLIYKIILLS